MKISEFYKKLDELYPASLSCSWDNDGLMCCGNPEKPVERVLVCLDATADAVCYASKNGFDVILTHHPMIFKGMKSVTDNDVKGSAVITCIKNDISVISLHTRLDAGKNGVNDALANKLGLSEVVPFGDDECPELGRIGTISSFPSGSFASYVRDKLGCTSVNAYLSNRTIKKVAVVGGGGSDFIIPALRAGADAFISGECHYNAALDAADMGLTVIEAGHYQTEFPVCQRLAQLAEEIADAEAEIYEVKTFTQI